MQGLPVDSERLEGPYSLYRNPGCGNCEMISIDTQNERFVYKIFGTNYSKNIDYNIKNIPSTGWININDNTDTTNLSVNPSDENEWIVIFGTANGWYNNAYWINNVKTTLAQNGTGTVNDYGVLVENNGITITSYFGNETQLTIPSQILGLPVKTIRGNAFRNNTNITSVTIPNSVTSIGDNAFLFCTSLTSVTIPNSVTSIGDNVFLFCTSLTSVTIPNSVTSIGRGAFAFTRLDNIVIPNSVTSIGNNAFQSCYSLISIVIQNRVTTIQDEAFLNCYNLTSVTIGNSVTSIGHRAFSGCSSLTSVTIPNSVTSIGNNAFANTGLTSIVLSQAFSTELSRIGINSENVIIYFVGTDGLVSLNGNLYTGILNNNIYINGLIQSNLGVNYGGYYIKYENNGITIENYVGNDTSIQIPNSILGAPVKKINQFAFFNRSLNSVTINHNIEYANRAFYGCTITNMIINNTVTYIPDYLLFGSTISNLYIPQIFSSELTRIGAAPYYGNRIITYT